MRNKRSRPQRKQRRTNRATFIDGLLSRFYGVFGNKGGDQVPGNVGASRGAASICRDIMRVEKPGLFDYFEDWGNQTDAQRTPWGIEQALVQRGQWEGAWALGQLHYDQLLKQEAKDKDRRHKGVALCNLALLGQAIGSPSLTRHYALLSSAGDLYWEHKDAELQTGGLGPTILERFESYREQFDWRARIRKNLTRFKKKEPVYLESFLATRWLTTTYTRHISNLAEIEGRHGKPFAEVLLDSVETPPKKASATATGTRFEAATGILISATPGFEVDSGRKTTDEQIDLVVYYSPEPMAAIGLDAGCGLVECKSSKGPVKAKDLRDFGAKCLFHRVKFGILIARTNITGNSSRFEEPQNAELVRRRFQVDGLALLVLDITQLRNKSQDLRGLQGDLSADFKEIVFGPVP